MKYSRVTSRYCGIEDMKEAPQIAPRGLCVVRVCDDRGVRRNADHGLCGTEIGCANRLRLTEQDHLRYPQTAAVLSRS